MSQERVNMNRYRIEAGGGGDYIIRTPNDIEGRFWVK